MLPPVSVRLFDETQIVTTCLTCAATLSVRLLLERQDTDVNLATYYGTTALTYAIR